MATYLDYFKYISDNFNQSMHGPEGGPVFYHWVDVIWQIDFQLVISQYINFTEADF